MSACEKCWRDSRELENYHEVLNGRKACPCTPEDQAGPDAGQCSVCMKMTLHQYTGEPMCGCKKRVQLDVGTAMCQVIDELFNPKSTPRPPA